MAEALDIDELRAHALTTIGLGKANLGNRAGIDDYERALKIALAINSPQVGTIINNIAVSDFFAFDFVRTDELFEEGQGLAERFGDAAGVRWLRAQRAGMAFMRGRWDDGLRQLDDFIAECERGSPHYLEGRCHSDRAGIREGRGDLEGALADYERSLALARPAGDPQALLPLLASAVAAFETHGRLDAARLLAQELVDLAREHPFEAAIGLAFDFAYTRLATEFDRELREALDRAPPWPWKEVAVACLDYDFVLAADMWARGGSPTFEARLRLRAAEELIEKGRRAEGEVELEKALTFYRSVGATFFLERGEQLFAKSA